MKVREPNKKEINELIEYCRNKYGYDEEEATESVSHAYISIFDKLKRDKR